MYVLFAFLFALAAVEQPGHQLHQPVPQPRNRVSAHAAGSDPDHFPVEIHRIHAAGVVGVFISDRAVAGGVRPGARRAVAFLCDDAGVDRAVHRAAGRAGRVAGDLDGAVSGPPQFSNRDGGNGRRFAGAGRRSGGRPSRPPTNCSSERTLEALDQLLAKTRFTMFPFLPSYWLSAAVLQWAEGILRGAAFFALVLLSHTLFFGGLAFTRFGRAVLRHGVGGAKPRRPRRQPGLVSRQPCNPKLRRPAGKNFRRNFSGSAATAARWPSRTCACSGATPRNGANP